MPRASRASRNARVEIPLGSLTQPGARIGGGCRSCGAERVTRIVMALTDGSAVSFVSCHVCEHRTWEEDGTALAFDRVLDKTRKVP